MNSLLLPLLERTSRFVAKRFSQKTCKTDEVQEKFLFSLLHLYQKTELGKSYHLDEIKTIDQFRDRVPVLPYSAYEPWIERIAQGEDNILTPDPVVYFNMSSGSTGTKKLIPVTQRFQNYLGLANLASIGFLSQALKARGKKFGRLLATNSAQIMGRTEGGIEYGPASVGVLRMGQNLYQQLFSQPYQTLKISDSVSRHYICLLFALRDRKMRGMAANFPMLILRICNYLEEYAEDLIQDIEKGTISSQLEIEPALRSTFEQQWTADPQRALELRDILKSEGRLTPKLAWPELSFIGTARGGTSDFYLERFPHYLEDIPVFGAVYSSSEATFSIYPDVDMDGSILAINTGFFEFIPMDQWDEHHPKTLLASEVKVGEYYRLLSTTHCGFYRYDIGDVVEVVGFYEKAPLIVFRHRRGGILSAMAEKTSEYHVTQVMQSLQQEFGDILEDFCLTLSESDIYPHYLINIELAKGNTLNNPQAFLSRWDDHLQNFSTRYGIARQRQELPDPRLRILAPGSFAILRQRQVERGIPDSQLKFPHISDDRQFLAGLPVLQEITMISE
jgi:hypothetical protein